MTGLSVKNLRVVAGETALVKSISFEVAQGEWFAIIGESGSGKSMTAHAVGGLLPDGVNREAITLSLGELDLIGSTRRQRRRWLGKDIAYVFQDYASTFSPYYRVGDHMDEALRVHSDLDKPRRSRKISEALEQVELPVAMARRYPFQLSGGQMQRVALATAMMLNPSLLIADEPTTALDVKTQAGILEQIDLLRQATNCAVLFITHDLRCVERWADRVAVMRHGEFLEVGETARIVGSPQQDYTAKLFAAVPSVTSSAYRLPTFEQENSA